MITGQAATVDPTRVGRPIAIIVEVMTERTSIDALNAMKSHFAVPEAICSGRWPTGPAPILDRKSTRLNSSH